MKNTRKEVIAKIAAIALAAMMALGASAQGLLQRPGSRSTTSGVTSPRISRPNSTRTARTGLFSPRRTGTAGNASASASQPVASASAAGDLPGAPASSPDPDNLDAADDAASATASDLNFKDAPVEMVLEVYGKLVDRTVLKEPSVPSATITLESRPGQKLTKDEQIEAIEVVLEMNGIHMENYGEKFVRAVPRKDARKQGIPLIMDPEADSEDSGKVVSMMIPFKNISAQDEAQKALEGFKSNEGLLQVFERTNSILVTDTRQNINRMLEIARAIDIATPVLENVFVRQIKNASAPDIKTALETIVTESQKELEKTGKAQQNAQANAVARSASTGSLLRRPGRNNDQPQTPTSVESLVTSVSDADRGLIRGKVLILADERSNKLVVITSKSNMDFFDKVIEQLDVETTPDVKVEVIRLKYADAEDVSDMINDLIGNSASSKSQGGSRQNANQNSKSGSGSNLTRNTSSSSSRSNSGANQRAGDSKAGELSKDNVTVLADKRINGLVVMARTEDMPTLHSIIESMDVRLSQVLIETVIIEVQLGDDLQTGVDWLQRGRARGDTGKTEWRQVQTGMEQVLDANGNITYQPTYEYQEVPVMGTVRDAAAGFMNRNSYALGGGGGGATGTALLQGLVSATTNVADLVTPIGGGVNYFLKSDRLNLAAVIQASKTDNRSKYLASPVIMTVDNKEATIEATQMRYLFKGYQYSGSSQYGSPVPDYEQKELGITIKTTPKINPNGTVMLTVEEEYSQEGSPQTIQGSAQNGATTYFDAATTITRKLSADVVLENGQTVVFGGLTQTRTQESESGIPFLKDIPWIGKWLFGSVSQNESRQELLVFMTPYVLDDAEMAQAEAFRRKKSMSDPNPWSDHGWSASQLADPMSKKEMMRRLKDEWKKQDEDRKTKLAIEKAKLERAQALERMDESERQFWIDAHREELEKEEKARFDEFVKEQSDLKLLATEIRERRLEQAEAKIGAADASAHLENEYGRLERERAAHEKQGQSQGEMPAESAAPAAEPAPAEPGPEPAETPVEPAPAEPASVEIEEEPPAPAEEPEAPPAEEEPTDDSEVVPDEEAESAPPPPATLLQQLGESAQ